MQPATVSEIPPQDTARGARGEGDIGAGTGIFLVAMDFPMGDTLAHARQ